MKVCTYNELDIVIYTRDEHCPPHVHVGAAKWNARFEFSFWHNDVSLWDVSPAKNQPNQKLLESLRQAIRTPVHLKSAREIWWNTVQSVCLDKKKLNINTCRIVKESKKATNTYVIKSARFNGHKYMTVLHLLGQTIPVEIEL